MAKSKYYRKFELPDWLWRRVITPIVLISIFIGGAFFQLNFPLFKKPQVAIDYNSATLTAHEQWEITKYTCTSMRKIYDLFEAESADPDEVLALARIEQKATGLLLKPWTNYAEGKKLSDDWHENANTVWANMLALTESYPFRDEPWVAKTYPRVANTEDFKSYLIAGLDVNNDDRLVLWMVVLKRCVYEPEEPKVAPIRVQADPTDSRHCPIYREYKNLNFNKPESAAIWAQNKLRIVSQKGLQSNQWTQLDSTLSSLLSNFTDVQLTMPSQAQVDEFRSLPPMKVLTNRLDLLCGA